jgi:polyisoprenoid-binding protein YceI
VNVNRTLVIAGIGVVTIGVGASVVGCHRNDTPSADTRAPAPAASSQAPLPPGALRFSIAEAGTATFLIDAPLEKIKGRSPRFGGSLGVDPSDLAKTTGEIDVDLDALKTETFEDPDKNAGQTGHAHNWLEIGKDVAKEAREANHWARLTVRSLDVTGPTALKDVPEASGVRTVHAVVHGDLWIHGVTSPKTVPVTATFTGFPAGPVAVHVVTEKPLVVSLKEHDIKPRDVAGKFLDGMLEKVGKKIDDQVQVSIDLTAKASKPEVAAAGQVAP